MESRLMFFATLLIAIPHIHTQDADWLMKPPLDLGRPNEVPSNLSIDQVYMLTVGSKEGPSSLIDNDGLILTDGDVLLTKDVYERVYGKQKSRDKRNALNEESVWPGAEIPYTISSYDFNDNEKYLLLRAMNEWERYTCLQFRPKNRTDRYWANIQNGYGGCNAALGFIKHSPQTINLDRMGCRTKSTIMHEMGHAIGLIHEHQRPDRDDWVYIYFQNINPSMIDVNFKKYPASEFNTMGVPYDYSSIMHYLKTAFSYDGKQPTIVPKDPEGNQWMENMLGRVLSYRDVEIVNKMYKCASHCPNKDKCGADGHLDENCNCLCKDGGSDCDTTSTKTGNGNCKNTMNSWYCYVWANQGECERNSFYMKKACAKACGACGLNAQTPGTCEDVYGNNKCTIWAERGDCVTNAAWMKKNCPKTCKLCSAEDAKPSKNCDNKYKKAHRCDQKARDGDCKADPVGMWNHCKSSCRWCDKQMINVIGTIRDSHWSEKDIPCKDHSPYCGDWAKHGYCASNPVSMYMDCPKTCGKCDDGTCKNLYSDVECEKKGKNDECRTNFKWMRLHCALTCRLGVCEGVGNITSTDKPHMTTARPNTRPKTQKPVPTTTQEPVDPFCFDKSKTANCRSWMNMDGNFCNRQLAADSCKKSCNYCGCKEAYSGCAAWAANGDCMKNPGFMLHNCQKSCKLC